MNLSKQRCSKCVGSFLKGQESCPACNRALSGLQAVSARTAGPLVDFDSLSTRFSEWFSDFVERLFAEEREPMLQSLQRWNHPIVLVMVVVAVFTVIVTAQLA